MEKLTSCSNDNCQRAFHDLNVACKQHNKVALEHKEFGDNQKKKVKEFREFNSKLHDDIDGLEEDIKAKDEFVTKLTRERNKLQAELKFYTGKVEAKNQDIERLEEDGKKQKEVAQKFFMKIMGENKVLKEQLEDANKDLEIFKKESDKDKSNEETREKAMLSEIDVLEKEIAKLHTTNSEKQTTLDKIEEEKNELIGKIVTLETKIENSETKEPNYVEHLTARSLEEELSVCGADILTAFQCKHCDSNFLSKETLKNHVKEVHVQEAKMNMIKVERKIAFQTKMLATSVNNLVKKEFSEIQKPCTCRNFCRISHLKHNWNRSVGNQIIAKFAEIKNCESENGEAYYISSFTLAVRSGGMSRILL